MIQMIEDKALNLNLSTAKKPRDKKKERESDYVG
jgi:hypothetical protein